MKRLIQGLGFAALLSLCLLHGHAAESDDDVLSGLRPGHPRLLFTDQQLTAAVAAAKSDPLRAALHARIIAAATAELNTTPIKHELIGPRLLDKSRTCISRVMTCAMAYRLTGDTRFAARAKRELLTAAAFPDWNPSHFLDVAEMSFAVGIGYDWLYSQLSAEEHAILKRALLEKSLVFAKSAYAPTPSSDKRLWWVTAHTNWNQVCNGGLLTAALALADEEPDLARTVVAGAVKSLPLAMEAYQPDGAYPEGPNYWGYGTAYNVIAIALLEGTLGRDFGLAEQPSFDLTVRYRLHVQGPTGQSFNYADGGANYGAHPQYTWLAQRFNQPIALAHSRTLLTHALEVQRPDSENDRFLALHAIWFPTIPPSGSENTAPPTPLDARFGGNAELAMFRSAWGDRRALFVGFKAGRNDVSHAHLDLGSFVLDADGVRWAEDLGPDDYNLPGYFDAKSGLRWTYYRLNNRSHNTLTPDNALQDPKAVAPLTAFGSTPARAFAVADLTTAYPGKARRIHRGIALLDRSRVLVQDDIEGAKRGSEWTWQLVTEAQVTIKDARHATLSAKGETLDLEIRAPADAAFSTRPARPPTAAEKQNRGCTAVVARVTANESDVRLAVLATPGGKRWPAGLPTPAIQPVTDWK